MKPINRLISPYNHYDYNNIAYIVIHYVGAQSSTAAAISPQYTSDISSR